MSFLTPDRVRTEHGLVIKEKIIPWGAKWPKDFGSFKKGDKFKADRLLSGGTGKVAWVTIHNTDDIDEAAGTNDAEQYTRATWPNANMADARVHYFIDETDCWQNLREDEVGWHAGDSEGNDTSLGIEVIMDGSGDAVDRAAEDRAALLAAILLDRHGLSIDRLTTHQKWDGKLCPRFILPHWEDFRSKVSKYLAQIKGGSTAAPETSEPIKPGALYRVQVGAFSKKANAERKRAAVEAAGFEGAFLACVDSKLWRVQVGAFAVKANAEKMQKRLQAAGFSGFVTRLGGETEAKPKKSIDELAREVIQGLWGNGADRENRLTAAGYDYDAVQARVNELLK